MAIITDSIRNVGRDTVFNIGLSKTIGNYSEADIWDFPYCASQWKWYPHIGDFNYNEYAPGPEGEPNNLKFPLKWVGRNEWNGALDYDPGEIDYNNPDGIFVRIIWLYSTSSPISTVFPNFKRSIISSDNIYIITQMDMTKCRLHAKDVVPGDYINPISTYSQTNYITFDDFKIIEEVGGVTNYVAPSSGVIFPAIMFQWNNKLHIHRLFQDVYNALDWSWYVSTNVNDKQAQGYEWNAQSLSFDSTQGVYFPINIARSFGGLYPSSTEHHETPTVEFGTDVGAIYQWRWGFHTGGRINPATQDTYLETISWYGMMFEHKGVQYKPIIKDGFVIGYTNDMSVESEMDNWIGTTKHDVPLTPPGGSGADDDMDSQVLGATGSSGGFTKFFIMSPQNLSDFLTDFYNRADAGETLSNNLVCSYILGVPSSEWAATDNIEITIHNSAQGTPFVSTAKYKQVTGTNNYIVAGNIKVPRKTNTFYDFAPYSTYELFIPCCGWISLPDTVAGRHIYVSIQIDIATCSAKGVVKFDDGAVCAVCSGVLGSSVPMQIVESGLLRGANVQAGANALGGALMSGAGFGSGNAGLGLGGISQVVSSFTQSAIAGNTNYTNQKGSSGDITQFAMGHKCYLKISYPPIDEVVNNSIFGHTVGYLCEEVGELSNYHGFTVCANPHVHISATSAEKEEIKRLLEDGVILP